MTDNATPSPRRPRPNYSRPTKYPARLSTMLTSAQREHVDGIIARDDSTLGEAARALLADGIALDAAWQRDDDLRADVERMAREAGVSVGEAIGTMLRFAVDESSRRIARNVRIAHDIGAGLGEMGFVVDGVAVGSVDINAH